MEVYRTHFWKKNPFLKLLIALIAGITIQWQYGFSFLTWTIIASAGCALLFFFNLLTGFTSFRLSYFTGTGVFLVFAGLGGLLTVQKDIHNNHNWFAWHYMPKDGVVATLLEPLSNKVKTYKAEARVNFIIHNGKPIPADGIIIIYIKKDSNNLSSFTDTGKLSYGSRIIFTKPLQEIKNSGNPGGFNYKRYCLFNGTTHQVFLKEKDFEILPGKKVSPVRSLIYSAREKVIEILRRNIRGEKETGLAEAMLIGYKDDLEQSLVQSYTNTGVVHIIAISGLHLGLIYWLLGLILRPLTHHRKTKWLKPLLIITGLWAFSLLAGAQPSVLRSAFMFTVIVVGDALDRKSSVYNTMAVSAFLLLCINPFWLWDVGFQLSYAAVLSIIIFMRPIYGWFQFRNKIVDFAWKMNAVTLAAQVLTLPLSIYHFHQFPTMFLITNFLAVPLSSIILLGEILLCAVSFVPVAAALTGKAISWLIWLMNTYIERAETLPGSLWDGLQISFVQAILLLLTIAGLSYWMLEKQTKSLIYGLLALLLFTFLRSTSFIEAGSQQKIVVYNVPQKTAVDFIDGRKYLFAGEGTLQKEGFARNFHLKPARTLFRIPIKTDNVVNIPDTCFVFSNKRVLLLGSSIRFAPANNKTRIDLLIISNNPKLYFKQLSSSLDIRQVVFDGSNPAWKVNYWKKDCDSLHIPWYDVTEKGAFVMTLR